MISIGVPLIIGIVTTSISVCSGCRLTSGWPAIRPPLFRKRQGFRSDRRLSVGVYRPRSLVRASLLI